MLWVAQCLLFLQSVAALNQVCEIYTGAREDGFKALALVSLSQNLPDSNLADLKPLIDEAGVLGATCCSDTPIADCERDPADLFQSAVCASESLTERNALRACCEKSGANRTECFVDHKVKISHDRSIDPERPALVQCEEFKKDHKSFVGRFIHSFSKRHPMLQPQIVLRIAKGYGLVLVSCCGEAESQTCFDTKKAEFHATVRSHVAQQRSVCLIHEKFGERILKAKKLVEYSQKVPQATLEELRSIVERILSTVGPCCHGNMVQCMREKKQNIDAVCANEVIISRTTGLAKCCEADVLSRGSCIMALKPDPKPEGLTDHYDVHAVISDTCGTFTKTPEEAMAKLIYEVSRRHPEASEGTILRFAKAAEQAFIKCCAQDDHAECVTTAMAGLEVEKAITDSTALYKAKCAMEKTLGHDGFEKSLMIGYTAVMPQASFDILHTASERVADIFDECCKEDPALPCIENKLTDHVDAMCHDNDPTSINPHIAHCCNQSYSTRRPCITAMMADTDFQPPELDSTSFPMGADLCEKTGRDLMLSEKRLLYNVVRHKTTVTVEQLTTIRSDYRTMKAKCCMEGDQAACFSTDVPQLVTKASELVKT